MSRRPLRIGLFGLFGVRNLGNEATLAATVDADRFVQVAANLLSNARHHGAGTLPIEVMLDLDGDALLLEVRNGGEPLDESLAAELFRPFKRGKTLAPGNHGGMGLGLYIAHQIVSAHGGTLRYEYRAPKVVFSASLPLAPRGDAPVRTKRFTSGGASSESGCVAWSTRMA